jgi:acyl-CoA thioesterase II
MTSYFQDLIRLRELTQEPLVYQSIAKPVSMGNTLPIAYGGYTCALAIQAAFHSLPGSTKEEQSSWAIYSANGLFLGPTTTESPIQYAVTKLRDTRSFATRSILASQQVNGKERSCFTILVDFTRKVPSAGPPHREAKLPFSYSASPLQSYPHPDKLQELWEVAEGRVKRGAMSERDFDALKFVFGLSRKVSTSKMITGGIFDETSYGIVPKRDTAKQLSTPDLTQRRNVDYFKARDTLVPTESKDKSDGSLPLMASAIQASYLAFVLDGALAFYPLSENGLALQDAGACSTLDFALRFHDDEYDLQDWHCREMRTYCADRDRTFSESLLYNLQGKLMVSTTQQCVLRSKPISSSNSNNNSGGIAKL